MMKEQRNQLKVRELYGPAHFGNTYECALPNEMSELLREAKFWGFNRYTDWFDTIDLYNIYEKKHNKFNMPEAIWAQKFSNYQIASKLGLGIGLVVTPNHVFSDQVTTSNEAVKGDHIFGQLVCPSHPGVTEMILENYRKLFQDFARRGLRLESISGGAYDYGGCVCENCTPWIVTFGRLFKQIAELAKEFFGTISVDLWGWWWTDEDHVLFSEWADAEAPGFFKAMDYHLPYGVTDYTVRPIPAACTERAFVHISYGEKSFQDSYCRYGANIAPVRLEKTIQYLFKRNATGFLAYSEGDHDDINKAIVAGLSSGNYSSADDVLQAYAKRHFGTDIEGWNELLHMMGDFESINPRKCRSLFDKLSYGAADTWRLDQISERLNMAECHQEVLTESEWTPHRELAAKCFIDAKERLYRQVWRLGLQRHTFRFSSGMPDWYDEYITRQDSQNRAVYSDDLPEA